MNRGLTLPGLSKAIGGTTIREGKSLPIADGCLRIDDEDIPVTLLNDDGSALYIEVDLLQGAHSLHAFFRDAKGNAICGAYYVRVSRLN